MQLAAVIGIVVNILTSDPRANIGNHLEYIPDQLKNGFIDIWKTNTLLIGDNVLAHRCIERQQYIQLFLSRTAHKKTSHIHW